MADVSGLKAAILSKRVKRPPRNKVFITRTRNVPDQVVEAVHSGINLMLNAANQNIEVRDLRNWGIGEDPSLEFASVDWYQERALLDFDHGFGRQTDAGRILRIAVDEPAQNNNPHFEAMIVDRDLNMRSGDGYINFIFAVAEPLFGFVISPIRFYNSVPEDQFFSIIRRSAAHEFGHVLTLVNRDHNYKYSLGMHCAGERGPCLMRQGLSVKKWLAQHIEETRANQEICPDCRSELVNIVI